MTELERLATVHKALSDETRLRMIYLLIELGELCVCDLETGLQLTQSKTSRHLGILKQAGLVRIRRQGTWAHYGIQQSLDLATTSLLETIHGQLGSAPEAEQDLANTRQTRRSCC